MRILVRLLEVVFAVGLLWVAATRLGRLPPLGPFLEPGGGVWAVARRAELPASARDAILGLEGPVDVRFDDRAVPHIFASTEEDAYRALGYVVARDRLFQMEIQTRATAGRLTELLGPSVLELDREQRSLGLAASADRAFDKLSPGSRAARATNAYAQGVNAWIDHMTGADLPLEFRLLNARPMHWEPKYSFYLMRRMGYTLAYQTDELRRKQVASMVGEAAAVALFPINSPIQEPIQPGPGKYPRYDWKKLPPPSLKLGQNGGRPDGQTVGHIDALMGRSDGRTVGRSFLADGMDERDGDGIGSNNWAVAPTRSANGHALLAGDPHLDLTLPSIWYEAHLVVTPTVRPSDRPTDPSADSSRMDVYGVTIPGTPGVVIGFNRDAAWTLTNTEADALDYYAETLNDFSRPTAYKLDGAWVPLETRVETFRGPHGEVLATDTIYSTHRGPVLAPHREPYSQRWTVLESSIELDAVLAAQRSTSTADWMSLTAPFAAPAQNGLVADRHGSIAIRSTGRFPVRPGDGAGNRIQRGDSRSDDWRGDWPLERYPKSRDPVRGFLSSANQQPLDPEIDPNYLGADWEAPWRAMRINAMLRGDSAISVDKMRRMQTDVGSARADFFVPYFLAAAQHAPPLSPGADSVRRLEDSLVHQAAGMLAGWNRRYERESRVPLLFETAMGRLTSLTWDELEGPGGRRVATPSDGILAELLQDSGSRWWDRLSTPGIETRDQILRQSLLEGFAVAQRFHGKPGGDGWRWDQAQRTNIYHLLRLPALSALGLPPPGSRGTISPIAVSGTNGSSWRMVVDLGPELRGWGTYPGGQSGNPVSPRYLDRVPKWVAGELDTLSTPARPEDLNRVTSRLELRPVERSR